MRYLLLIYDINGRYNSMSEADQAAEYQAYMDFGDEAQQRGVLQNGNELESTRMATTVRVRDGKTTTTDGPFAETKEHLGGYYLLNCDNLDIAVEMAAKIPGAKYGSVEIRPIVEYGQ
jgi:hypothetical protein